METQTQQETVTLTIDDQQVTVPKGMVVVDAAKTVDIEIPVFCYHEKLGPFGCCRMCMVEVEKMPKLATACTLQVSEGMVVRTNTQKVEKAQQGVLEFTLLNHPLDCPVCDKGGECPLQDNTFKFGPPDTRMQFERYNRDKATPLSPVITIDRERCIACQRCTRYSDIIEKDQALVMRHRGFQNRVSTFNDRSIGVEEPPVTVRETQGGDESLGSTGYYLPAFIVAMILINGVMSLPSAVATLRSVPPEARASSKVSVYSPIAAPP